MRGLQERGPLREALTSIGPPDVGDRASGWFVGWTAVVAIGIVLVDQLTKTWALARLRDGPLHLLWTLRLNLSFNPGLAFSQGRGLTPLITVAALALVGVLLALARKVRGTGSAIGLGLLLGGACGNLADRLFRDHGGAVIDFIDLQWWPIFNVADMAITLGAVLLLLTGLREPAPAKAGDGTGGSG